MGHINFDKIAPLLADGDFISLITLILLLNILGARGEAEDEEEMDPMAMMDQKPELQKKTRYNKVGKFSSVVHSHAKASSDRYT